MPYITVGRENSGNIELHYEDYGSGTPIICIHGYPLSGRAWEKQIPMLVELGYRVISYDRRGFGNSSQPWTGYNYDTFAEDLHMLIGALKLQEFALMGHSMGGGELARYTGKYGTSGVTKMIFVAAIPPYLRKAPDNPEGVDANVFEQIRKAVIADRPAFMAKFFEDFYNVDQLGGKRISEHDVLADWHTAVHASPRAAVECVDTWGTDFRNDLKRIDVPALVIQGDQDRIVPLKNSGARMPGMIKGCRLIVIQGAPHGLAWTHAEELNRAVSEFLGRAGRGTKVA
jgi:pimeloyl-ACP methyl ester carboxylesterase